MILLACGGRDFKDEALLDWALTAAHAKEEIEMLIHGGARGADLMAGAWAQERGIHTARVDALWDVLGKRCAGPRRNEAMLRLAPDGVIAFPGGTGTAHMVGIAREACIPVWQPRRKP